jgi:hypothetical protein
VRVVDPAEGGIEVRPGTQFSFVDRRKLSRNVNSQIGVASRSSAVRA